MEFQLGSRVTYGTSGKTGTIRYIGEVDTLSGDWAGIELDKPEGKHHGELNGKVYFTCPPNHGVFVKVAQLKTLSAARSSGIPSTGSTSRMGMPAAPVSASAATVSRLQQLRDRRASGMGLPASAPGERRTSAIGLTGSSSISRGTAPATPSAVSPGTRTGTPTSSVLRRTPSTTLPAAPSSTLAAATRSSVSDSSSARRLSMGRAIPTPPPSSSSTGSTEELADALSRIAKLEEELDDRDRQVEQLKQSLVALREAKQERQSAVPSTAEETEGEVDEAMEVDDVGPSTEAVWLEKIETIRQEAEEHVRSVRAELEDHISQLQAEHEDLVDELRLENATQSSEIKALEAEVAQQKARIAHFTVGEQKKAEEVALAMAKTSAGARKVEGLEAQLTELNEMVETLTLEKETLEMDKEIAEERVEELVAEVEKLKTSLALATIAPTQSTSTVSSADIAEENGKLRAAVKALHDRSSEEKNELNKKLRQLQRENSELHALREEVEQLASKKTKLEGEVEELKELLDVANAYESMVEDLTEKNLTLGDRVAELEASVTTLESLKEMSDEVEHQQNEYVAELSSKIETQQARLQELRNAVAEQKTVVEDKDRTIARFRDATNRSREEISQLKAQLRADTGELESLKGTTHSALNQTMALRALAATARENEAEAAKQRINADQARLENAFLRAAIPNSIFSEMDQKVLRVRLRLGRIAGKADILLQYIRKEQLDWTGTPEESGLVDSERSIQQLLLGEKLSALSCEAKEDLFVLECHMTTAQEYSVTCGRLDTPQVEFLESALDYALTAFADGSLFVVKTGEMSAYSRLAATADEWIQTRAATSTSNTEGFATRCAVVKLRAKRHAAQLAFSFAEMATFVRTIQSVVRSADAEAKPRLVAVLEALTNELVALLRLGQQLHRRVDIDLSWSEEDLDGSVAVGGDVVELVAAHADEGRKLWGVVQEQLSIARLEAGEDVAAFVEQSLLAVLVSVKERLASLFKVVCRGAFTDAVSSRTRDRIDVDKQGRPQWQIRTQAIHKELSHASTLQANLNEMSELSQALHTRVRELERSDSQHRVVAQKLESEVLRLSEALTVATSDKTKLGEQLTRERDQFNLALDESHKEKAVLDNTNRELRKQLKRASEVGAAVSSSSSSQSTAAARGKSSLSQGDAEAFRKALTHLHGELHRVRATLAKERLDRTLGCDRVVTRSSQPSERLVQCVKDVAQFSRQVKTQLSMPRMVDLSATNPREQLVQKRLDHVKWLDTLAQLRTRISASVQADGWHGEVAQAIEHGETVFGWRPPEMERPPVLLSRVTLAGKKKAASTDGSMMDEEMEDVNRAPVQLILDRAQVGRLTRTLVC